MRINDKTQKNYQIKTNQIKSNQIKSNQIKSFISAEKQYL